MILISLGCAWIAGILLGSFFNISPLYMLAGMLSFFLALVFRNYRKAFILAGLCVLAGVGGAWYCQGTLPETNPSSLNYYNDSGEVTIRGTISREPELKQNSLQLHVRATELYENGSWEEVSGTALVFVPLHAEYAYGDVVRITGKSQTPPQLDDFDYERYLAIKGIYTTFTYPQIQTIETGTGAKPLEWIYNLRNRLSEVIGQTIPEPQASLTRSVLLGMKASLHDSVKDEFHATGASHLLAISGLHLSIIAGLFITLGRRWLGRKGYWYVWLALVVVWFYAVLSGLNPPVVRAAIMVSVYLASQLFGRQNSSLISLVVAAAVMTWITPSIIWDAAFQMSFAAMAGLILVFPLFRAWSRKVIRERLGEEGFRVSLVCTVADSLSISLGAVLAVWPLIAWYFGTLSPVSPIVTLLALPFLPLVLLSGALTGLAGLVFLPMGQVIGWTNWFFASCILDIVHVFSFIPPIRVTTFPFFIAGIYYLVLPGVLRFVSGKMRITEPEYVPFSVMPWLKKEWLTAGLAVLAVCVLTAALSLPGPKLRTSFLDVGQGESILISKGSRQILIDGGPDYTSVMYGLGRGMPFWDRTIDLVILTHPDADHLTGLMEVMNRYRVTQVVMPDIEVETDLYKAFQELLLVKGIPAATLVSGQKLTFGDDTMLEVLNPGPNAEYKDIDNKSFVLKMISGSVSFLFTGDILADAELDLVAERVVTKCTVLKAAHHGSASSSSDVFLDVVNPAVAVISAGVDNRFGHPSDIVLQRFESRNITSLYRTDRQGTITFITDGTSLKVQTER